MQIVSRVTSVFSDNMADDGTGKPRWPYTSVEYLNRAGAARKKRVEDAERANSPWIGLAPADGGDLAEMDSFGEEGAVGGQDEHALIPNVEPPSRPTVSGHVANKLQRREEPVCQNIEDTVMSNVAESEGFNLDPDTITVCDRPNNSNIPQLAAMMAQVPGGMDVMLPDIAQPPPAFLDPVGLPGMARPTGPIAVQSIPYPVLQTFLANTQRTPAFSAPPPEFGRFQSPRIPNVVPGQSFRNNPGVPAGCQTPSGFKPMYVKSNGGPAGMPDARVQCPRCHDDRWYIDLVTPRNPYYNELHIIDSRMRCLNCHGDVWQVDLLTSTTEGRTAHMVDPNIHSIDRLLGPRPVRQEPVGPTHSTPGTRRFMTGGNVPGGATPESGYQSAASTPSPTGWNGGSASTARRLSTVRQLIQRRRAIRRMLFNLEEEHWDNEEL